MTIYKCDKCEKVFNHRNDYRKHSNRKNPCLITIENKNKEKTQKIPIDFGCPKCNKVFNRKYNLNRHILYYCNTKIDPGNKEQNNFPFVDTNNNDFLGVLNENDSIRYDDIEINSILISAKSLAHTPKTNKKKYVCEHCKNKFTRMDSLKKHLNG